MTGRAAAPLRLALALERRMLGTRPAPAFPGTAYLELPSAVVRLRRGGGPEGVPVVVVPDPPNTLEHYDAVWDRLASRGPAVAVEAPGFGFSLPRGEFSFRVDDLSRVLEELLESLGFRRATLSLACVGAFAALRLAARRPDLVGRLVLSQVASRAEMSAWVVREDLLGVIPTPILGQLALRASRKNVARWWYRAALPREADPRPWQRPTLRALGRGAAFPLASSFQIFARDPGPPLPPLSQPVTILFGSGDRTHAGTDRRSLLADLPRPARLIEYPSSGHFPDLENTDEWLRFVRE